MLTYGASTKTQSTIYNKCILTLFHFNRLPDTENQTIDVCVRFFLYLHLYTPALCSIFIYLQLYSRLNLNLQNCFWVN